MTVQIQQLNVRELFLDNIAVSLRNLLAWVIYLKKKSLKHFMVKNFLFCNDAITILNFTSLELEGE